MPGCFGSFTEEDRCLSLSMPPRQIVAHPEVKNFYLGGRVHIHIYESKDSCTHIIAQRTFDSFFQRFSWR